MGVLTAIAVRVADTRGTRGPGIRRFIRKEGKKKTVLSRTVRRQVRICIERLKFRVLALTRCNCFPLRKTWAVRAYGSFCGNILQRAREPPLSVAMVLPLEDIVSYVLNHMLISLVKFAVSHASFCRHAVTTNTVDSGYSGLLPADLKID